MGDRLLVLALVGAAVALVWLGLRWRSGRYRARGAADLLASTGGRPLVLAFSTPECVPCRAQQKPALAELLRRYPGRLVVREVDAAREPDLADRFGIMTVPSTVVVDHRGRITAINHGVARWEQLAAQLRLNGLRVADGPVPVLQSAAHTAMTGLPPLSPPRKSAGSRPDIGG